MSKQTIKEYVLETFDKCQCEDIINNGMSAGFGPLVYYTDTCAFHDEFEDEIWDFFYEQSKEFGSKHILAHFASFNGAENVGSMDQFKNLLCWAAVEEVARQLVEDEDTEWPEDQEYTDEA